MPKQIYIPLDRLSVLQEYTDPDTFTIGAEDNAPIGGGYAHKKENLIKEGKLLNENITDIVYHFTDTNSAKEIVRTDVLKTHKEQHHGDKHFISTTRQRNRNIGFPLDIYENENIVRFQLDGYELNKNPLLKSKAWEYYGRRNPNKSKKALIKINKPNSFTSIESEDRIECKTITFPHILKYVTRIDIDLVNINRPPKAVLILLEEARNKKIIDKVFIYNNSSDFNSQNGKYITGIDYLEKFSENSLVSENIEYEVEDNDVNLSSFKKQETLAPKIWDGEKLNPKVKHKLLDIADDFWDFVNIQWVEPESIVICGSICNYNWSKYSDIDLHLLVDFSKVDDRTDFVKEYFDSKKNDWNDSHDKLKIYGYTVELYVQDVNADLESSGTFDVENNKWLEQPNSNNIHEIGVDKYEIKHLAAKIMTEIDDLCDNLKNTTNKDEAYRIGEKGHKLLKKIQKMRKYGLNRGGESDKFNIVYKCLRRTQYLDKLWDLSSESYDKVNSIYETIIKLKQQLNEEVVADGNAQHNIYSKRWKQEREDLKNFILHNGKMMTSKENGKRYFVYYDKTMSELVGNNYCVCLQYNPITLKPSGTVYIRALDKFTDILFTPQQDTRGFDNVAGTNDDILNAQSIH